MSAKKNAEEKIIKRLRKRRLSKLKTCRIIIRTSAGSLGIKNERFLEPNSHRLVRRRSL